MLQLTVTSIQSERSRQYETEQVYFFYKVFSRFYVFRRDPCGGIPPVYIEAAGKILKAQYWPMLIIFGLSGICGLVIVFQLRKMMKTVVKRECFVDNNTRSLSTMGKVSFVITVLFAVKCVMLPTPASFIIVLTFFIAGMFSHVLSLVFEEAVRFKEENDLTI